MIKPATTHAFTVKAALLENRYLTVQQMVREMGINRLTNVIWKLRKQGINIVSERINLANSKHYFRYWLASEATA